MAYEIGTLPRRGMIQVAKAAKAGGMQEAIRATGDGTLSMGNGRWYSGAGGGRPRKLGLRDTIRPVSNGSTCRIQGKPAGPWVWLDSGTSAHLIGVGRSRAAGRSRGKRGRIYSPDHEHPVIGPIIHPGSPGKQAWTRVVERIEKILPAVYEREVSRLVLGR